MADGVLRENHSLAVDFRETFVDEESAECESQQTCEIKKTFTGISFSERQSTASLVSDESLGRNKAVERR